MAKHFQDAIVLFGDSLTQEWGPGSLAQLLSEAYMRRMDVLNRGFGGYTTEWCLPLLDQIFATKEEQAGLPRVKLVTIWFGTNDACLPSSARSVSVEKYRANLSQYISALTQPTSAHYQAEARIILITPPPIVPPMTKGQTGENRDLEHTRRFKDACLSVAQEWKAKTDGKVQAIDLWEALFTTAKGGDDERLRPFFTDGVHLSPKGYQVLFDEMMRLISASGWEDLIPARINMTVPRYLASTRTWVWYR